MSRDMLAVDVGGTFTDVIGVRAGQIEAIKVPSRRQEPELSVIEGAAALGAEGRAVFNHASTVGLNAVITRRLPKVGFVTTFGHRDMLDTARSWRPLEALTDAGWRRPFGDATAPLVARYLRRGIRERMMASGEVLVPLDEDHVRAELERFKQCGVDGIAVCLLNAYINDAHERRVGELIEEVLPGVPYSLSASVSPLAKEYQRATTTVIDVFMKLIFTRYVESLDSGLREKGFDGDLNFADSAAMLIQGDYAMKYPYKLVFSGPAAGAVASAHFGTLIGDDHLLCCDVGGTSSDISLVTGGVPYLSTTFQLEPDMIVNSLAVELGTLGAGGGSMVISEASGEIRVGPESAGGDPGPACYGRGGTAPTMTDIFLLIGLLDPGAFNAGRMSLDKALSLKAFEDLDSPLDLEQRISFAYRIGLNNVAEGLIDVAIGRGVDPRDYSLVAFGAAGPLFLPAVLDDVKARRVIVPPYPGLFSALGLLSSNLVFSDSRSSYTVLTPDAGPGHLRDVRADGGGAPQARLRRPGASRCAAPSTAASSASRGTRRSSPCRAGRSRRGDRRHDLGLPRRVPVALRQPLRGLPGRGRHLSRRGGRHLRQGRVPEDRAGRGGRDPADQDGRPPLHGRGQLPGRASTSAATSRPATSSAARRSSASRCRPPT